MGLMFVELYMSPVVIGRAEFRQKLDYFPIPQDGFNIPRHRNLYNPKILTMEWIF